jgi:hypothetical protein
MIGRSLAPSCFMRITAALIFTLVLGACSQSEQERTREQARRTGEEVKRQSKEALHQAEIEARKAGREINEGLEKTREKVRGAVNDDKDHR